VDLSEGRRRVAARSETALASTATVPDLARGVDGHDSTSAEPSPWRRRSIVGATYAAAVGFLAYLYGLVPGGRSLPLETIVGIEGWIDCMRDGLDPCTYIGYPTGVPLTISKSVVLGATALSRVGLGVESALNLMGILCIAAGVAGLWLLAHRLTRNHFASLLTVALYFGSPFLVWHVGLVSIFYGFALLPGMLALAYLAAEAAERPVSALPLSAVLFAAGLALIYADPYPYVIASACCFFLVIARLVSLVRGRKWVGLLTAAATLVAIVLPAVIYRLLEGSSGVEVQMPQDFYRAEGVDIGTMVIPTRSQVVGKLLQLPINRWRQAEFFGNYAHLASIFLGPVLLVTAAVGAVLLIRRVGHRWVAAGLCLTAVACFVFAVGPSLKVLSRSDRPIGGDRGLALADYLMPARLAIVGLPWSALYRIQPFASMRYTYRWQAGFLLAASLFAAAAVAALAKRRRLLAAVLALVLILEATPVALLHQSSAAEAQHDQFAQFHADVAATFDGHLAPGERVLFLPTSNDFLIENIAPRYRLFAYNIAFDKAIPRIQKQQPRAIVEAEEAFNAGTLGASDVCGLFAANLVDAVVFTEFDPNLDAYHWPPRRARRSALRAQYRRLLLDRSPALTTDHRELAVIVRRAPSVTDFEQSCTPAIDR
jgi:hypothetical protein